MYLAGFEVRKRMSTRFYCLDCLTTKSLTEHWSMKSAGGRPAAYVVESDGVGNLVRLQASGMHDPDTSCEPAEPDRELFIAIIGEVAGLGLRLPPSRAGMLPSSTKCTDCKRSATDLPKLDAGALSERRRAVARSFGNFLL